MTTNRISLLLEIVSFFCVTIDLYGKERLAKLSDRLRQFFSRLRRFELSKPFWQNVRDLIDAGSLGFKLSSTPPFIKRDIEKEPATWFMLFILLIGTPIIIWALPIAWKLASLVKESGLLRFIAAYFIAIILIGILLWLFLLISGFILAIMDYGANAVIRFSIFLLARMKLEGVLLVIGTVIFLASKIIAMTIQ